MSDAVYEQAHSTQASLEHQLSTASQNLLVMRTSILLQVGALVWGSMLSVFLSKKGAITLRFTDVVAVDCWDSQRDAVCCQAADQFHLMAVRNQIAVQLHQLEIYT